jgi:hypothetical protein
VTLTDRGRDLLEANRYERDDCIRHPSVLTHYFDHDSGRRSIERFGLGIDRCCSHDAIAAPHATDGTSAGRALRGVVASAVPRQKRDSAPFPTCVLPRDCGGWVRTWRIETHVRNCGTDLRNAGGAGLISNLHDGGGWMPPSVLVQDGETAEWSMAHAWKVCGIPWCHETFVLSVAALVMPSQSARHRPQPSRGPRLLRASRRS